MKKKKMQESFTRLKREGLFYVPFRMKRIIVENIGPIKKLDIFLKDINLILGKGGSGKSILLRLIHNIGNHHPLHCKDMITQGKKRGKIRLELAENIRNIEYLFYTDSQNNEQYQSNIESKCFLVDDALSYSDSPKKVLDYLKRFNSQIIITCRELPNISLIGVKIIRI